MSKKLNAIRGMRDILPDEIGYWHTIEQHLRTLANSYNYQEIRLPVVESTELFKRSVGQVTDIVEKEMYTFLDRNGDSLTLRPEGTAGVVRAGIEHSLFYGHTPRVWYLGPMFRHERPQKGRYRQFYQFGMEAFGFDSAHIDAEVIMFCVRLWKLLGLENKIQLQINCLGTAESRANYKKVLISYFKDNYEQLDQDSQIRLDKNPLRILDSKNSDLKQVIANAPKLSDHLDERSTAHMTELCNLLDSFEVSYQVNPYLVRGLDYYGLTVFEWVTDQLGSQGTVCAGGRYDSLTHEIGGQATSAMGMSLGMERLVLMLEALAAEDSSININNTSDVFMALVGEQALHQGMIIAEKLRDALPKLNFNVNITGQSFKGQLKKADKSKAKVAIIIGDDEITNNYFTVKFLREKKEQLQLDLQQVISLLGELQ